MGSWDATCGVSRLPIREGSRVKLFFITQSPFHKEGDPGSYPTEEWEPLQLPLDATYENYGRFMPVNLDSDQANYILDFFRKNATPREVGENEYHDIAVVPSELTWKGLNDAIHENRLQIPNPMKSGGTLSVQLFPVLEPVYKLVSQSCANQEVFLLDWTFGQASLEEAISGVLKGEGLSDTQALIMDEGSEDLKKSFKGLFFLEPLRDLLGYSLCLNRTHIVSSLVDLEESLVSEAASYILFTKGLGNLRIKYALPGSLGSQSMDFHFKMYADLFQGLASIASEIYAEYEEDQDE